MLIKIKKKKKFVACLLQCHRDDNGNYRVMICVIGVADFFYVDINWRMVTKNYHLICIHFLYNMCRSTFIFLIWLHGTHNVGSPPIN
jgi:hypothetical protein